MPPDTKRRLLYNRKIAGNTFVLFFHKGPGETSWSVRDYSVSGSVSLRDAADFQDATGRIPLASEIRAEAEYDFPAPTHPTTDIDYWHAQTKARNAEFLAGEGTASLAPAIPRPPTQPAGAAPAPSFPILNLPILMDSPKAEKRGDIERILHSQNSEDYVTWNFFQLLHRVPPETWWPMLLKLTGVTSLDPTDAPTVQLWHPNAAPRAYEARSRERMRTSGNSAWSKRSLDPGPVEGPSEIDIALEGRTYLAFVEAKLGSDVSLSTTYDPQRNQIARNIDCALDACGARRPVFWMFVRDRQPTRAYMRLMERYRSPAELGQSLPHCEATRLEQIAATLAVVTWSDLLALLAGETRTRLEADVERELRSRVGTT